MNNKDEKTFADLFSSSEKEELKKQSFSSIFDNEERVNTTPELEVDVSKGDSITFDNIFQENKEDEAKFDIFAEAVKQTEELEENVDVKNNLDNDFGEELNPFMSNSFNEFDEKHEELEPISSSLVSDVIFDSIKEDNKIIEQQSLESNPFFSDNNEPLFGESKIENVESLNSKIDNPFFENSSFDEKEEGQQEEIVGINPLFQSNSLQDNRSNPFFEEKISESDFKIESEQIQNDKIEENSFYVDDNPFFKGDNKLESNLEVKDEKKVLSDNDEVLEKTEEPKSSSPFFQEENTNSEENPFFQNQLNLVENKNIDTPVGVINTDKVKHYNVKVEKKKEPLLKFIIGVCSYALFIFLLLIGITLLIYVLDIKIRASKGDYSPPAFNAYVVLTGSMLPEIEVNDVVVTKKVDAKDLKERDIITFASDDSRFRGTIITHRIIKKNPPSAESKGYTFQTRGDNNNVADSALVPEANIYGKVILKIPKLGYLQHFLASDGGWIIVILIPCLTVISYDIVKLVKGLKRKKYKNIKVQK